MNTELNMNTLKTLSTADLYTLYQDLVNTYNSLDEYTSDNTEFQKLVDTGNKLAMVEEVLWDR